MKRSPFTFALTLVGCLTVAGFMFMLGKGGFSWEGLTKFRSGVAPGSEAPMGKYSGEAELAKEETVENNEADGLADEVADRIKEKLKNYVVDLADGQHRKDQTILRFTNDAEYQEFLKKIKGSGMAVLNTNAAMRSVLLSTPSLNHLRDFLGSNPSLSPELTANPLLQVPTPLDAKDPASSGSDTPFSASGLRSALGATNVSPNAGSGIKVAILDSAVAQIEHFGNSLVVAKSALTNPTADLDHGTAVASLVKMVAPGVTLHSYPVVAEDGMSDAFTISDAITQAVNNGANIINISLGSYESNASLAEAVAYAKERGVTIVASAGNEGLNNSTYPARYPGVSAALAGDASGMSASFSNNYSNFGAMLPGVGVSAVYPDGNNYAVDGTSFSSPIYASMIANVMQSYRVTSTQAVEMLQSTANDSGAAGPDSVYGYGWPRLDDVANSSVSGYTDGRVASNYVNSSSASGPTMDYVVQNNGTTVMSGWNLSVNTNGATNNVSVPSLQPNQSWPYSVPFQVGATTMNFSSQLTPPSGITEASNSNNAIYSSLSPTK